MLYSSKEKLINIEMFLLTVPVLFSPNQEGDNVGLVSVDDQVNDVRFERLCAEMCQDMRDDQGEPIKCNSFAYCFADNRCLLSTNHVARPGSVKVASYCRADTVKYYNRTCNEDCSVIIAYRYVQRTALSLKTDSVTSGA